MRIGRYLLRDKIASGANGTVYLGKLLGDLGFSRIVAIKRLKEPELLKTFLDEARLAGRVRHPNVVPTLDVVDADGELLIVMEYVHAESLAALLAATAQSQQRIPVPVVSAILAGVLYGLHAAHEAVDERGRPLGIVHRDVSPPNVLVGTDGTARVVDFGIAKAAGRLQTTRNGKIKGKLGYMSPEQARGEAIDRRVDIFAAGVLLWEMLVGHRPFQGKSEGETLRQVLFAQVDPPSALVPTVPAALDAVAMRALARHPTDRFSTAREMSRAILDAGPLAAPHEVGEWVEACAHESLARRAERIVMLESEA